ncbi:MAG: anthranilate phosphoribosyltransferase [Nitrospinae bacterium]|nr:anthranilate phosphoribosyltransferase [Nitrospinota bacterium]
MDIKSAIARLIEKKDLAETDMVAVMEQIMTGGASEAQIGSFLTALRMKGETVDEITGAARVMREKALKVAAGSGVVVDTCGTGGDGASTFNISTTAAFVAAGAGLTVAKHGNRAISSKSGSADVLKALGVNVEAEVARVEECLAQAGIGFLFAPVMHSAMKHVAGARRDIGVRTVFNVLGPLTNPAGAKRQVVGVYSRSLIEPIASTLKNLGAEKVFVVHGHDGLDEITVTGPTDVAFLDDGKMKTFTITPEQFGMPIHSAESLKGGDAQQNAKITMDVLNGQKGAHRDITLLNAAAVICAGGLSKFIDDGLILAEKSLNSGNAAQKLATLRKICGA